MLFATFLGCIEAIARLNDSATAGNIRQMVPHLSIGQVRRALSQLESEGYVLWKIEPHGRTGKRVYFLASRCVTNVFITNKAIGGAGYDQGQGK